MPALSRASAEPESEPEAAPEPELEAEPEPTDEGQVLPEEHETPRDPIRRPLPPPPPALIEESADDEAEEEVPVHDSALFLRQNGQIYMVGDWATLERWIAERRVDRDDEVSAGGVDWETVGDIDKLDEAFRGVEDDPPEPEPEPAHTEPDTEPTDEPDPRPESVSPPIEQGAPHGGAGLRGVPLGLPELPRATTAEFDQLPPPTGLGGASEGEDPVGSPVPEDVPPDELAGRAGPSASNRPEYTDPGVTPPPVVAPLDPVPSAYRSTTPSPAPEIDLEPEPEVVDEPAPEDAVEPEPEVDSDPSPAAAVSDPDDGFEDVPSEDSAPLESESPPFDTVDARTPDPGPLDDQQSDRDAFVEDRSRTPDPWGDEVSEDPPGGAEAVSEAGTVWEDLLALSQDGGEPPPPAPPPSDDSMPPFDAFDETEDLPWASSKSAEGSFPFEASEPEARPPRSFFDDEPPSSSVFDEEDAPAVGSVFDDDYPPPFDGDDDFAGFGDHALKPPPTVSQHSPPAVSNEAGPSEEPLDRSEAGSSFAAMWDEYALSRPRHTWLAPVAAALLVSGALAAYVLFPSAPAVPEAPATGPAAPLASPPPEALEPSPDVAPADPSGVPEETPEPEPPPEDPPTESVNQTASPKEPRPSPPPARASPPPARPKPAPRPEARASRPRTRSSSAPPRPPVSDEVRALVEKGWREIDSNPVAAERTFEEAVRQAPDDDEANYGYGYALLLRSRPEAATYLCRAKLSRNAEIRQDIVGLLATHRLSCDSGDR